MFLEEKVGELNDHNRYLAQSLSHLILAPEHIRQNRSIENELQINRELQREITQLRQSTSTTQTRELLEENHKLRMKLDVYADELEHE